MAIANGYCTLNELKQRLFDMPLVTATTISFTAATKKIADSNNALKPFGPNASGGNIIRVSGSTSNDGDYTIAANGGDTPGSIIVTESLIDEAAGQSVTIIDVTYQDQDTYLESVIEAASRWIDGPTGCNRRIYAATETRYYTAQFNDYLIVDDLLSVTTLKTDDDADGTFETTWASTDYLLAPFNASQQDRPYDQIHIHPDGDYTFPKVVRGVEITGSFGYASTTPPAIKEACILASMKIVKRKDAIFGVTGSADMGQLVSISKLNSDPDIRALLDSVPRRLV